ncbi:MAG: MFS transporter [Candidatus Acidiferrum sp.]|jgi:MFS family permease
MVRGASSPGDGSAGQGLAAFRHPDFLFFQFARFLIIVATEMQSVAVGWQIYASTKRALDLGLVGLAQFLPGILLFLLSGHVADRLDRRKVIMVCYLGFAICSALLMALAATHSPRVAPIYSVLVLLGVVRSFNGPVTRAILPQLVPEEHFQSAVAWASTIFQGGTILGPALGGLGYAIFRGPAGVYAVAVVAAFAAMACMLVIKTKHVERYYEPASLATLLAGVKYIWTKKLILGSISLDLFAVLLGGAVALLPVFAQEILHTGPAGLGLLRSAPGVGAASMALLLAYRPLRKRAGATMLWCVAGFGACTIVFGVSHGLVLSLVSLALVGATDMVSVVVRGTLIQVATPDEMRGRVNAVDMVFIGASNQLGQFESGITAQWFGAVPAVILGGVGTLVVVALWAWCFPELRNADKLVVPAT